MGNYTEVNPTNYTLTPGGYNLGSLYLGDQINITSGYKIEGVEGFEVSFTTPVNMQSYGSIPTYLKALFFVEAAVVEIAEEIAFVEGFLSFGTKGYYFGMYNNTTWGLSQSKIWGHYTTMVYPPSPLSVLGGFFGAWNVELTEICTEAAATGDSPGVFDPLTQGVYMTLVNGNSYKDLKGEVIKLTDGSIYKSVTTVEKIKKFSKKFYDTRIKTLLPDADAEGQEENEEGIEMVDLSSKT
jgi:hypothetical protein